VYQAESFFAKCAKGLHCEGTEDVIVSEKTIQGSLVLFPEFSGCTGGTG